MAGQNISDPEAKTCRACCEKIHNKAKICRYCGSRQNPLLNFIQTSGLILSTIVAFLSLYGFYGSSREAGIAKDASEIAVSASNESMEARRNADLAASSANKALMETVELKETTLKDKLGMLEDAIRSEEGVIDSSSATLHRLYNRHGVAPGDRHSISELPEVASQIDELGGIIEERKARVRELQNEAGNVRNQIDALPD